MSPCVDIRVHEPSYSTLLAITGPQVGPVMSLWGRNFYLSIYLNLRFILGLGHRTVGLKLNPPFHKSEFVRSHDLRPLSVSSFCTRIWSEFYKSCIDPSVRTYFRIYLEYPCAFHNHFLSLLHPITVSFTRPSFRVTPTLVIFTRPRYTRFWGTIRSLKFELRHPPSLRKMYHLLMNS